MAGDWEQYREKSQCDRKRVKMVQQLVEIDVLDKVVDKREFQLNAYEKRAS